MNLESIQLIKCLVENKDQQSSYRLIEKSNFDLWSFLMNTKHHIKIQEKSLCLWLSESEFKSKEEIYRRAGDITAANKLQLMMYDNYGNFSNTCRYVPESDTQAVREILISHLPEKVRLHDRFTMEIEAGQLVTTGPHIQLGLIEAEAFS